MSTHDMHALTGAYAMDALDELERARFELHLTTCPECAAEVAELRETATALGSLAETTPPAHLRDRVLTEISTVRPLPPTAPSATQVSAPEAIAPRKSETSHARRLGWRSMAAAAAAVAVVGAGTVTVVERMRDEPSQIISVSDRILRAPDAQSIRTDLPGSASARLVRSVSQGKAVLITSNMSDPPPGKVYELWLQSPTGDMLPAGLIDGGGDREVVLDGDAATAVGAGITVEPLGGSDVPTSAPIALFDFEKPA